MPDFSTCIAKVIEEVDTKARYDTEVKKVLSDPQILFWILKYTVREFKDHTIREDIYGHMASTANQHYDLMELSMVCLGRPEDAEQGTRLHQLLGTVLSDKLTPKEKIETMKNDYNIITTVELEGGLATMCNLSDYIVERATERGLQQSIQQGISEERLSNLRALMKNLKLTAENAMDVLNVPQEERAEYMAKF